MCSAFGTALFHEPIVAAGSDGLVIVRDITFAALSEQTLLPFHGRCHIAYVPSAGVVLGLSKLARVTKCLAARLQTQQQFTERLVAAVGEEVQARGVAAVVQAVHLGEGPAPPAELSSAAAGCFCDSSSGHLAEFLALLRLGGRAAPPAAGFGAPSASDQQQGEQQQQQQEEQPVAAGGMQLPPGSAMLAAADTLLQSVGENPARKVRWLGVAGRMLGGMRVCLNAAWCCLEPSPACLIVAAWINAVRCCLEPCPACLCCCQTSVHPPTHLLTSVLPLHLFLPVSTGPQGRLRTLRSLAAACHGRLPHAAARQRRRRDARAGASHP